TTTRTGYVGGTAQVSATSLYAALTPTFGTPTPTADGFTVQISNYSAAYTWGGSATAGGSVAISGTGLVTVTGVAPGTSSTATITTTRTGYVSGSAAVTATSIKGAALTPTFGSVTSISGGFTVQITNYSASYTWGGSATGGGSVSIDGSGLVTVTGVTVGSSSTATITTTRTGYNDGSASVTANAALTATFGAVVRTASGFKVQISNYDGNFTWAGSATASGTVGISGTGLVTVTGVAANTSSTATITTSRTGYVGGTSSVTGKSIKSLVTVGTTPWGVAVDPLAPAAGHNYAYVTNSGSSSVSRIDLSDDSVVTIGAAEFVPASPKGIAIDQGGTFAIVTSTRTITKIDLSTFQVVGTSSAVGDANTVLADVSIKWNATGATHAYVVSGGTAAANRVVYNFTVSAGTPVLAGTSATFSSNLSGIAITPTGSFAYVTNSTAVTRMLIPDSGSPTVSGTALAVSNTPLGIAIDSAGTFAYVTRSATNRVATVDLTVAWPPTAGTITAMGSSPTGIALNPGNTRVLVTNALAAGTVSYSNLTGAAVGTVTVGSTPRGIAITPLAAGGAVAYVANSGATTVSVLPVP
ncbi:MAG: hypothetical protein WCI74_16150, partial [Actinomycetes bacterium]